MRTVWLILAFVCLAFCLAFDAHAASLGSENIVVVVVPTGDNVDYSPFENRLRSELTAAGHSTVTATLPAPIESSDLPTHARRLGSDICISISISDGMVVGFVSVADPASEKIVVRSIPGYPAGEQAPSIFAVRATDVLHGVLLELNYVPNAPQKPNTAQEDKPHINRSAKPAGERKAENPAAEVKHEPIAEQRGDAPPARPLPPNKGPSTSRHWGVSVGAGLNAAGHSLPLASGGEISVFRQERDWGASVEASAYLPVDASSHGAEIAVNQWLVGASFHLYQPLSSAFKVFESFGSGLYGLSFSGLSTNNQGTGHNVRYVVGYSNLGLGILSEFNERTALALRFRILAPWRVGDVIVRDPFGDNTVAQLKFPVMLGDLGLRVTF